MRRQALRPGTGCRQKAIFRKLDVATRPNAPDIQVFMDDVVFNDKTVEYHWTFAGTNTGPGGTGRPVRISGFDEWTFGDGGLVAVSRGSYDQDQYDRQFEHGAPDT